MGRIFCLILFEVMGYEFQAMGAHRCCLKVARFHSVCLDILTVAL